jgi:hypothetical protein
VAELDEVDEAALGEVVGAAAEQRERRGPACRRAGRRRAVEREEAAVVLEDRAGLGLGDPGAELDLGEPGRLDPRGARHADHVHARTSRSGAVG